MTRTAGQHGSGRARTRVGAIGWLSLVLLMGAAETRAQVVLRPGPGVQQVSGAVSKADETGVLVDDGTSGGGRLIGWDRVESLAGNPQAAAYLLLGDRLWRARTRIERSDWLAAAPILRELAPAQRGKPGPTAAVLYEGLLRCELARGARAGALGAWFDWLVTMDRSGAIRESGVTVPKNWIGGTITSGFPSATVVDPRTGLSPMLAPIWVGETAVDAAASTGQWDGLAALFQGEAGSAGKPASGVAAEYVRLYLAAAKHEAGRTAGELGSVSFAEAGAGGEGVRLVRLIVLARAGDAQQREVGRTGLVTIGKLNTAEPAEPWVEAWCRAGIGRSLLREPDEQQRTRGVLELLHVPARFAQVTPDLAAVCLAEAAAALWDIGDHAGASTLKGELAAQFPNHPATQWTGLDKIRATSSPAPARESLPEEPSGGKSKPPAKPKGGTS